VFLNVNRSPRSFEFSRHWRTVESRLKKKALDFYKSWQTNLIISFQSVKCFNFITTIIKNILIMNVLILVGLFAAVINGGRFSMTNKCHAKYYLLYFHKKLFWCELCNLETCLRHRRSFKQKKEEKTSWTTKKILPFFSNDIIWNFGTKSLK
jgi:hypothetical protein